MRVALPRVARASVDGWAALPEPPPPQPTAASPNANNNALRMLHSSRLSGAHHGPSVSCRRDPWPGGQTGPTSVAADRRTDGFLQEAPAYVRHARPHGTIRGRSARIVFAGPSRVLH